MTLLVSSVDQPEGRSPFRIHALHVLANTVRLDTMCSPSSAFTISHSPPLPPDAALLHLWAEDLADVQEEIQERLAEYRPGIHTSLSSTASMVLSLLQEREMASRSSLQHSRRYGATPPRSAPPNSLRSSAPQASVSVGGAGPGVGSPPAPAPPTLVRPNRVSAYLKPHLKTRTPPPPRDRSQSGSPEKGSPPRQLRPQPPAQQQQQQQAPLSPRHGSRGSHGSTSPRPSLSPQHVYLQRMKERAQQRAQDTQWVTGCLPWHQSIKVALRVHGGCVEVVAVVQAGWN